MSCLYAELNNEALLHITGPDALKFLQGQTTCDTSTVNANQATPGAYCTPKGRVVCDFLLCEIAQNHFALRLRRDILDISAATFGKYIVFSKAELEKDNTDWQVFACWGDDAASILHSALGTRGDDKAVYGSWIGDAYVLIQTDEAGTCFECYINHRTHPKLVTQLKSVMSAADENTWRAKQIERGIARIEAATVENFIPQMLNYDLTGHISFSKGCYTGQEVVARMHYRGKPKKRLYRVAVPMEQEPAAGTSLYADGTSQSAGTLVNAGRNAKGQGLALIVAPVAGVETGLHLGTPDGLLISYDSTG